LASLALKKKQLKSKNVSMIKTVQISALLLLLIMISCTSPGPELPLWLEGEWKTNNKSGFAGETWQLANDTLLSGEGLVHVGGQYRVMEKITIFSSNGNLYYGATVSGQNEGKQVLFTASHIAPGHLVFLNPEHDFPTRIVYKLKDDRALEVNISGRDKEDSRTIAMFKQ
jgi:hypothetical protein